MEVEDLPYEDGDFGTVLTLANKDEKQELARPCPVEVA